MTNDKFKFWAFVMQLEILRTKVSLFLHLPVQVTVLYRESEWAAKTKQKHTFWILTLNSSLI